MLPGLRQHSEKHPLRAAPFRRSWWSFLGGVGERARMGSEQVIRGLGSGNREERRLRWQHRYKRSSHQRASILQKRTACVQLAESMLTLAIATKYRAIISKTKGRLLSSTNRGDVSACRAKVVSHGEKFLGRWSSLTPWGKQMIWGVKPVCMLSLSVGHSSSLISYQDLGHTSKGSLCIWGQEAGEGWKYLKVCGLRALKQSTTILFESVFEVFPWGAKKPVRSEALSTLL